MNHCVQESMSSYLDNRLPEPDRRHVARHLVECGECAARYEDAVQIRRSLRSLPMAPAPARLATDLQILASKEVLRRRRMRSLSALMRHLIEECRLPIDNLMRPVALPVAGGLVSALFIFLMLIPSLGFLRDPTNDKPTALYTEASVVSMAAIASRSKGSDDTLVEVQIDGSGHMVDYRVLQGQMTSEIGNLLLFTTFTPATMFLQPTSGKIVIRRSQIVVKG
jgi:hypothetical protein